MGIIEFFVAIGAYLYSFQAIAFVVSIIKFVGDFFIAVALIIGVIGFAILKEVATHLLVLLIVGSIIAGVVGAILLAIIAAGCTLVAAGFIVAGAVCAVGAIIYYIAVGIVYTIEKIYDAYCDLYVNEVVFAFQISTALLICSILLLLNPFAFAHSIHFFFVGVPLATGIFQNIQIVSLCIGSLSLINTLIILVYLHSQKLSDFIGHDGLEIYLRFMGQRYGSADSDQVLDHTFQSNSFIKLDEYLKDEELVDFDYRNDFSNKSVIRSRLIKYVINRGINGVESNRGIATKIILQKFLINDIDIPDSLNTCPIHQYYFLKNLNQQSQPVALNSIRNAINDFDYVLYQCSSHNNIDLLLSMTDSNNNGSAYLENNLKESLTNNTTFTDQQINFPSDVKINITFEILKHLYQSKFKGLSLEYSIPEKTKILNRLKSLINSQQSPLIELVKISMIDFEEIFSNIIKTSNISSLKETKESNRDFFNLNFYKIYPNYLKLESEFIQRGLKEGAYKEVIEALEVIYSLDNIQFIKDIYSFEVNQIKLLKSFLKIKSIEKQRRLDFQSLIIDTEIIFDYCIQIKSLKPFTFFYNNLSYKYTFNYETQAKKLLSLAKDNSDYNTFTIEYFATIYDCNISLIETYNTYNSNAPLIALKKIDELFRGNLSNPEKRNIVPLCLISLEDVIKKCIEDENITDLESYFETIIHVTERGSKFNFLRNIPLTNTKTILYDLIIKGLDDDNKRYTCFQILAFIYNAPLLLASLGDNQIDNDICMNILTQVLNKNHFSKKIGRSSKYYKSELITDNKLSYEDIRKLIINSTCALEDILTLCLKNRSKESLLQYVNHIFNNNHNSFIDSIFCADSNYFDIESRLIDDAINGNQFDQMVVIELLAYVYDVNTIEWQKFNNRKLFLETILKEFKIPLETSGMKTADSNIPYGFFSSMVDERDYCFTSDCDILGISSNLPKYLSMQYLDQAFRKMSLKNHPDKGGDTQTFQNINNAKDRLTTFMKSNGIVKKESKRGYQLRSNFIRNINKKINSNERGYSR